VGGFGRSGGARDQFFALLLKMAAVDNCILQSKKGNGSLVDSGGFGQQAELAKSNGGVEKGVFETDSRQWG
jgi:hypothetical protein